MKSVASMLPSGGLAGPPFPLPLGRRSGLLSGRNGGLTARNDGLLAALCVGPRREEEDESGALKTRSLRAATTGLPASGVLVMGLALVSVMSGGAGGAVVVASEPCPYPLPFPFSFPRSLPNPP